VLGVKLPTAAPIVPYLSARADADRASRAACSGRATYEHRSERDAAEARRGHAARDAQVARAPWCAWSCSRCCRSSRLRRDFGRSLLTQMAIAAVFALSFNCCSGRRAAVVRPRRSTSARRLRRHPRDARDQPADCRCRSCSCRWRARSADCRRPAFGALTTRKAGTIFALISLGVGELVYAATFMLPGLFGGEEGITASRTRARSTWGRARSQLAVYYAVVVWALLRRMLMYAFTRTPVGRMCNAVRDNPERAEFSRLQHAGACASSRSRRPACSRAARRLHAINYEIVAADAVSAQRSGTVLIMAYIGGAAHFVGPVLGAIVITWLQSGLSATRRRGCCTSALLHRDDPVRAAGSPG
jgi:hypothetical protein